MFKVVPSIIPHSKQELGDQIELVAPFAKMVQVDICDGVFARPKTWPYNFVDTDFFDELKMEETGWPKWEETDIEVHLMVQNPETVCEDWIKTGVTSIVAHIEATQNFQKIIDICRPAADIVLPSGSGHRDYEQSSICSSVEIWVAIKPSTDVNLLAPFVAQVNGIQVMGSDYLGEHGVGLEESAVQKIKLLRQMYPESIIAVDIGVSPETKDELVSAGATKLISGSAILEADNPREVFNELSA
jgi:ribulose-phosphate 3-epimerase